MFCVDDTLLRSKSYSQYIESLDDRMKNVKKFVELFDKDLKVEVCFMTLFVAIMAFLQL